ncbi:MAG: 16S rRNA (cytidine(1402)-2'-O)-methyltransferase [Xanthomonadaceae bacterium]|nr:16S rRNA (cytidine(1402)-2'-O)-methyltransferase [Xanthomonadaceae bacterium]
MGETIKRHSLPSLKPGFYFVSTPIGNLGDLSARARQVLEQADVILCEDTRSTLDLYRALGLTPKKLLRSDQHSTENDQKQFGELFLSSPGIWAVVSDAGTPGVSDPGALIARLAAEEGIALFTIPGASSATALLSIAGFESTEFAFMGFFPRESKEIIKTISSIEAIEPIKTFIFFESPHRIENALEQLEKNLKKENGWIIAVGKELTKLHEKFWRGDLAQVSEQIKNEVRSEGERGEWVFALHRTCYQIVKETEDSSWINALDCLLHAEVSTKLASQIVSRQFHVPKNDVYELAIKKKSKK